MDKFVSLLWSVIANLFAAEIKDWLPVIALWLTNHAVRLLPTNMRDRYSEEWLSHLDETRGDGAKVFVALGFALAAFRIAYPSKQLLLRAVATFLVTTYSPIFLIFWTLLKMFPTDWVFYKTKLVHGDGKKATVTSFRSRHKSKLEWKLRVALRLSLPEATWHGHPYCLSATPLFQRLFLWSGIGFLPAVIDVARGEADLQDLELCFKDFWYDSFWYDHSWLR